jgi:hypothetical protein
MQEAPSSITVDPVDARTFLPSLYISKLYTRFSGQGNSHRTSGLSSSSTTNRLLSEAKWASGNSLLWLNQPHRTAITSGARHAELAQGQPRVDSPCISKLLQMYIVGCACHHSIGTVLKRRCFNQQDIWHGISSLDLARITLQDGRRWL